MVAERVKYPWSHLKVIMVNSSFMDWLLHFVSCPFHNFYAIYNLSDQVVASTKSPRSDKHYVWEAVADSSSYVIREETDPEKLLPRGTQITLYLKVLMVFLFRAHNWSSYLKLSFIHFGKEGRKFKLVFPPMSCICFCW